jgi:hypothetical protein
VMRGNAASSSGRADGLNIVQLAGDSTQLRVTPWRSVHSPGSVYHSGARRPDPSRASARRFRAPPYKAIAVGPDIYNRGSRPVRHGIRPCNDATLPQPAVTGTYRAEGALPPTPPIRGLYPYRVRAWSTVYQHDGLIVGQYVALAGPEPARVQVGRI